MMADAFSMFDYGNLFSLTFMVSWLGTWFAVWVLLFGVDSWLISNRVVVMFKGFGELFGTQILGVSRVVYGFSLFCLSLFIYLAFVGIFSIFPYMFCMTAHFSHNFCISMVMWFGTLVLNILVGLQNFMGHFTPGGLVWYQAAPVAVFEMISNLSRIVTLGARLTMNMIAGKLLLCVGSAFFGAMFISGMVFSIGGFCFLFLLLALTGWEMIVGIIQAYIFTFLSVTYVDEIPVEVGGN